MDCRTRASAPWTRLDSSTSPSFRPFLNSPCARPRLRAISGSFVAPKMHHDRDEANDDPLGPSTQTTFRIGSEDTLQVYAPRVGRSQRRALPGLGPAAMLRSRNHPLSPVPRGREGSEDATQPERSSVHAEGRVLMSGKLMDPADVRRALTRIAHEILERDKGAAAVVLVGIAEPRRSPGPPPGRGDRADRGDGRAGRRPGHHLLPRRHRPAGGGARGPRDADRRSTSPARRSYWSTTCCSRAARSVRRWTR